MLNVTLRLIWYCQLLCGESFVQLLVNYTHNSHAKEY